MHSDCPFCLENKLIKTPILAETAGGFLIPALGSEGNFLIIPKQHAESPADIPDSWWVDFKELFDKTPIDKAHYNISLNKGEHAGQTVNHLHFWIIPRQGGQTSSGQGLASLVDGANQE